MRKDTLLKLDAEELESYSKVLGIDLPQSATIPEMVDAIENARNRTAVISVMGIDVIVPIKNMHDKRVLDRANRFSTLNDAQVQRLFEDIVGKDQAKSIVKHVTDEDGVIDCDAYGLIVAKVLTNESTKNF